MKHNDDNVVETNKHYWKYVNKVEELCQLIFLKHYRGYKGTKKEKLKQLEKLINDEHDAWAKKEAEFQKGLDEIAGYDEKGNAYTYRDCWDLYDYKDNKPGIKLTKEKPNA